MKIDFYNQNREGIQIMSIRELASRMYRMELDESLDIYANADKKSERCFGKTSIKRSQWNGTEFFLIKDERDKVHVVDYAVKTNDYIEDHIIPVLNILAPKVQWEQSYQGCVVLSHKNSMRGFNRNKIPFTRYSCYFAMKRKWKIYSAPEYTT